MELSTIRNDFGEIKDGKQQAMKEVRKNGGILFSQIV